MLKPTMACQPKKKLELLTKYKQLPEDSYQDIWNLKQQATQTILKDNVAKDYELMGYCQQLVDANIQLAVASNSIRSTVKIVLLRLGLLEFVDVYISNEDVIRNKPFPEMYWKCMTAISSLPNDTVIFEDSHIGRQGALDSKCHLIPVENRKDLDQKKINRVIKILKETKKKSLVGKQKDECAHSHGRSWE